MNLKFIWVDFYSSVRAWLRSPGTVFWTILFPVLLIMIFGAIFSGSSGTKYDLVVQNLDEVNGNQTNFSKIFIDGLKDVDVLKIIEIGPNEDISKYMQDNDKPAGLQIPKGFGEEISYYMAHKQNSSIDFNASSLPFNLTLHIDPSDQTTTPIIRSILTGFLFEFNKNVSGGDTVVSFNEKSTIGNEFSYIDFFVPGMIGFTIMTSMIYGSIERNTKYRKDGILRKLLTMPVTRSEWILSKMMFMLFLSFISTFIILAVGILVWHLNIIINLFFFVLIISTSFLFSGMGMIVSRFVKEEDTADMAGGAITFPMMFLAGTFFPLAQMPAFLQSIAQVLPLYYVNEALRNAMIYANYDKTIYFTAFVLVFAFVFFIIGVLLTKWKED
jgi:ABC-2 type transport system permease protein